MKSKQKKKGIILIGIGLIFAMFLSFNNLQYAKSNGFMNDNGTILSTIEASEDNYDIRANSFNSTGEDLVTSLFSTRNQTFSDISISEGGITIENGEGNKNWNMTDFTLNFTDLRAKEKLVKFETRNDGSLQFREEKIYYASSFQVPNTCNIKNLSMFVQYPGGKGTGGGPSGPNQYQSSFNITIFNSSSNMTPAFPIHDADDNINFNLSDKLVSQPARWYQSNFTDMFLNISETYNNTFFAVFQSIDFPSGLGGTVKAYMYYAEEQVSDEYDIRFLQKNESWNDTNLEDKNGLFRVGFAPFPSNPSANQLNLSVFAEELDSNIYIHDAFFPHEENEFSIPISSPWFGDIIYNMTFEGNFQYYTVSSSHFKAATGKDVNWSLTLKINNFQENSYNRSATFYKPHFWKYLSVQNGTVKFNDTNVNVQPRYVQLFNVSNGPWTINFNQTNDVINSSYYSSESKLSWDAFDMEVNAYNYINITSSFNCSEGNAFLYIYTPQLDLKFLKEISNQTVSFPLWQPRFNTSIYDVETVFKANILATNGTMAGFTAKNFTVIFNKTEPELTLSGNLGDHIYGNVLELQARLSNGQQPLVGEIVYFKFVIDGGASEIILNDTTDDEGIARVSFMIGEISSIRVYAYYDGSIDYTSSASITSTMSVQSPLERFFWDSFPFLIMIMIGIAAISSYIGVKRYRFKKMMKEWKKKTGIFSDVLTIDLILVLHKEIGVALLKQNFTKEEIDGDMIGGFLQAITNFKYEIKDRQSRGEEKESILLDYRDYKILLEDGEYIRCALILNSEPSDNIKISQKEFISDFEGKYRDHLANFKGELDGFRGSIELIDKHFNMAFIKPHIVNENPPAIELTSFQKRVVSVSQTLQSDSNQFYISRLLNYLISAMPDEPKEKIIANIYDAKRYGFIKPI